jgi:hypothetical protein
MKKSKLISFSCVIYVLFLMGCGKTASSHLDHEPKGVDNLAYKWAQVALEATARDTERFAPRPTVTSRYLALIVTSMFDAWSVYDDKAVPVYLQDVSRRLPADRTLDHKKTAISYAAFRTLLEYFPSDSILYADFMSGIG